MYGTPWQVYSVGANDVYRADGTGLIANVALTDIEALAAQGCMSEAQWLSVQAAHLALSFRTVPGKVGFARTVQQVRSGLAAGGGVFPRSASKYLDAAMLAKVGELELPAITRSGPIEAWIIDDTGFRKKGRPLSRLVRPVCAIRQI